jgi:hypothetical protein
MSKTQVSSHTALIVVAFFLGATAYAYAVSDEIQTASGRSFMIFTVSLAIVWISSLFWISKNHFLSVTNSEYSIPFDVLDIWKIK